MKIKYVHTNIIAKDWEALANFYSKALNCKKQFPICNIEGTDVSVGTGVKNAKIKGMQLELPGFKENAPTLEIFQYGENKPKHTLAANREGITHLAFHVDDIRKCINNIIKHGGKKVGELVAIQTDAGTLELVYMADPENNIIELLTVHEKKRDKNMRNEIIEKLKTQLDNWNGKIENLESKLQSTTAVVQDKYKQEMEFLKSKRDDLKNKLDIAKSTGEEALDELKTGLHETTATFKKTFDNIWTKFKK
jgi:predicted enzyme related to lactoylglutathione lyase